MMRVMTVVALTTMGYFILGVVGLVVVISLGYSTIIWPASGLAVAASIFFLKQAPFGIFLGSLLLNIAKPISQDKLIMILTKWLP